MEKIFIYTCPCERRRLDAKKVTNYFYQNNFEIINDPKKADFIFLFTCAIFDIVAKESFRKIREFKKYNGELIVAGCLPEIRKEELSKIFNGRVIVTKNLDEIDKLFPDNKVLFKDIDDANSFFRNYIQSDSFDISFFDLDTSKLFILLVENLFKIKLLKKVLFKIEKHILTNIFINDPISRDSFNEKIFQLRISTGCPNVCSYCNIKKAVGPLKSKPLDVLMKEYKKGLERGYKIFRVLGDDTGSYGLDIGKSFPELLDKIIKIQGDSIFIISGLNPKWAVKYKNEICEILKSKKIKKVDIPIQSGNSRILGLMKRYLDVDKINEVIKQYLKVYPDLIIETHCILGFPTETWEEFIDSLKFIKNNSIYSGYILQYSCDKNTVSGKIEPKVTDDEMLRRIKYAKQFLKEIGYSVIYIPRRRNLRFNKFKK